MWRWRNTHRCRSARGAGGAHYSLSDTHRHGPNGDCACMYECVSVTQHHLYISFPSTGDESPSLARCGLAPKFWGGCSQQMFMVRNTRPAVGPLISREFPQYASNMTP